MQGHKLGKNISKIPEPYAQISVRTNVISSALNSHPNMSLESGTRPKHPKGVKRKKKKHLKIFSGVGAFQECVFRAMHVLRVSSWGHTVASPHFKNGGCVIGFKLHDRCFHKRGFVQLMNIKTTYLDFGVSKCRDI